MSRVLSKSVVTGGVVYPAGATVPNDVADRITADVFVSEQDNESKKAPAKRPAKKSDGD